VRVLHVSHQYLPAVGGSEQYMAALSEELVQRGHRVDVATTRAADVWTWRSELPPAEQLNGVGIRRFSSVERGRLGWHALRLGNTLRRLTNSPWAEGPILVGNGPWAPGLAWHVARHAHEYDVVHVQTLPYAHVLYGLLAARVGARPVVITPHIHVDQPEVFDLRIFGYLLRAADLVIAVSEREVPYLVERGVQPRRIQVAGNGVRLAEYPRLQQLECRLRLGLPPNAVVLLFLGRKVEYKGLRQLVQAFKLIGDRNPNLYLISAGPSTEESRKLRLQYAGLPRWLDRDTVAEGEKLDLLNACDVLILPSTGEAFGIVFLEAWAAARPVIGARAGAIPWVIDDGQNGLLVTPGDAVDLAAAIQRLVESSQLRHELGSSGYEKVRRCYTVERITDRIEDAYHELLANRGRTKSDKSESGNDTELIDAEAAL
jgi:glycosyltransferase involved in cell wall biosynthesis